MGEHLTPDFCVKSTHAKIISAYKLSCKNQRFDLIN